VLIESKRELGSASGRRCQNAGGCHRGELWAVVAKMDSFMHPIRIARCSAFVSIRNGNLPTKQVRDGGVAGTSMNCHNDSRCST
jgi:hypothetical protein